MNFEEYYLSKPDVLDEVSKNVSNLASKLKEPTEKAKELVKVEFENKSGELYELCDMF